MRNYDVYYKKMGKNVEEKTGFLIEILKDGGYDEVVDFGCANGKATEFLATIFPEIFFVGVEKKIFIKLLKKENSFENIQYTSVLEDINWEGSVVFLSSILHEIFTFEKEPWDFFEKNFFDSKMIVIRDMYHSDEKTGFFKVPTKEKEKEFLNGLGKTEFTEKDYAQYLIKSLYDENWKPETKEDYFSVPFDQIIEEAIKRGFELVYDEPYKNEYIENEINKRFGIEYEIFGNYTHRKIILKKRV